MSWENTFSSWSQPPGQTEKDKMNNAEVAIRKAIANHALLSGMDISIFPQGSYRANTTIRQDSDVDVCVRLNSTFFTYYPEGRTDKDFGNVEGSISFMEFKNFVEESLNTYFGSKNIKRGNKAFDIHSNSYRVDADVVPAFAYRYYLGDGNENYINPIGIAFDTDKGNRIINWPDQTYSNGVDKNNFTSRRYKKIIRIIKNIRNKMQEDKISEANNIASFLIESLVWNTPNEGFGHSDLTTDVRYVLAHTFNNTLTEEACYEWGEVNEVKYLFRSLQPWNRSQAHNFISAAWDYIGFK
ncbi:MAG: nucleotidyltransferase [Clostridiaceae bacterium]|nr:nucleotidyltransferase [Clostridiaceae bacterium]